MINKLKRKLKSFYLYYTQILKAPNDFNIERKKSIKMKLNGFTPEQYILYGFDKGNNPKDYINEIERWNTREVNGYYKNVLDDKLLFYEMFHKYIDIPQNLFWIKNRKILDMNGNLLTKEQIAKIIKNTEIIFIKPVIGGGGRGVYKVSYKENFLLNNKQIEFEELLEYMKQENDVVATEGIEQYGYANKIYPNSVNTIRILTTYNLETNNVSIPEALHRFGTEQTQPVDNASVGGLFSIIDIDTGKLSEAKNIYNEVYEIHPNSGVEIKNQIIPKWKELKSMCLKVASEFPYIPYMAWDIVITEKDFKIIEINASTDLFFFQMWEGKRDSELGDFFRANGVMK